MAVGDASLPELHPVAGIRVGTVSAGIKKAGSGRRDLVVFELCPGSATAGVYTSNAFRAAPVTVAMEHAAQAAPRYFLVNTGNANAGTGAGGLRDARECCRVLAEAAAVRPEEVLPFSTGVIGQPLPVDRLSAALPAALEALDAGGWTAAASGIMTTDTRPKGASRRLQLGGSEVTITGIAKGAGMIKPNMATMLGFVATDAAIAPNLLQDMLRQAARLSFNRITVDGDTSTNDCCMLAATGRSSLEIGEGGEYAAAFRQALNEVFVELAQAIVKDAEGATKFVTVRVEQGASVEEALRTAYTVAESPLVKTALFASDPNWGRILAAVGRAGLENLDIDGVEILLGDVKIVENGGVAGSYTEEQGAAVMGRQEIDIVIRLGRGDCSEQVWTCDFSYDYVKINAEYRT